MAADSVSGGIFHSLYYLYMGIALTVGALVLGWLAYILIKYRARPGVAKPRDAPKAGVLPAERGHPIWSYVMALVIAGIMFGLAFGTISATHELETPPEDREHVNIELVGFQFGWKVIYTGVGGVPVSKINEWTVPVDTPIVANVTSQDVWHNFALTEFRMRIDVIPGQTNHIWWEANEVGDVQPVCVQLCGVGHALMKSKMHVVEKGDFTAWLSEQSAAEYAKMERAGQLVNVTYDGASFAVEDKAINGTKAFAVRINNQGPSAERFTFGTYVLTLAAGETGNLAPPRGATKLEALNTDAFVDIRSDSEDEDGPQPVAVEVS